MFENIAECLMTCVAYNIESPKSEPALELQSRAAPSVEANPHVNSPITQEEIPEEGG